MEEQQDTAPREGETPKNTSRRIGLVLGVIGLVAMIGAAALAVKDFGLPAGIDLNFGKLARAPFVIELDAAGIEAELARLNALPGETLSANLERIARARTACIAGLMVDKPRPEAVAAATRLFVVLFAARKRTELPLIDPRFFDFAATEPKDVEGLIELAENGTLRERDVEKLRLVVQEYVSPSHPIYSGLDLETNEWAFLDFKNIVAASGPNSRRVRDCYRARFGG